MKEGRTRGWWASYNGHNMYAMTATHPRGSLRGSPDEQLSGYEGKEFPTAEQPREKGQQGEERPEYSEWVRRVTDLSREGSGVKDGLV